MRRLLRYALLLVALPASSAAQRSADVVLDSTELATGGGQSLVAFLAGRVPGLSVHAVDGAPGMAMRVTSVGASGTSAAPEPLLYVDGVLLRDDPFWSLGVSDPPSSLGWGLPVDELAEVRVVLGAASAGDLALGASRGAVFVTTRRPGPGPRRVAASMQILTGTPSFDPRLNEGTLGQRSSDGSLTTTCTLAAQVAGGCTALERTRWDPLRMAGPYAPSAGLRVGVDASGPVGAWRYRASLRDESAGGTLHETGTHRLDAGLALRNAEGARVDVGVDVRVAHIDGRQRTWQDLSPQFLASRAGPIATEAALAQFEERVAFERSQGFAASSDRLTLSVHARRRVAGVELLAQASADEVIRRGDRVAPSLPGGIDYTMRLRTAIPSRTASVSARGEHRLTRAVHLETTARADWTRTRIMDSLDDISPISGNYLWWWRAAVELSSIGFGSHLRIGDRLRVGGAVRDERLNGVPNAPIYPSADVAIDLIRPGQGASRLSRLRLVAAYGEAADHRSRWALYEGLTRRQLTDVERTTERRIGIDLGAGQGFSAGLSRSSHATSGGTICCRPPVFWMSSPTPVEGTDWRTDATLIHASLSNRDDSQRRWNLRVSALHRRTVVTRLPGGPFGADLGSISLFGWFEEGAAPFTLRGAGYSYADQNGDGVIVPAEVTFTDDAVRLGSTEPRWTLAATGRIALRPHLELGATAESRLGHVVFDQVEAWRCGANACRALHDPRTSLAEQAAAIALTSGGRHGGFVQPADHVRLREIYLQWPVGRHRLRFSAHQLLLFSRFRGGDPESASRRGALSTGVLGLRQPIFPTYALRLDLGL